MKTVKGILLGSAAGLVAVTAGQVTGAQAADLLVKAKPVEYVRVCSLYGAGYYYLPGTDICVKWGGFVRAQYYYDHGSAASNGPIAPQAGMQTRTSQNDNVTRARWLMSLDTRQQTDYGTLRTYFIIGASSDGPADSPAAVVGAGTATSGNGAFGALYANRAFLQYAGFTMGKTQSYFDLYSGPAVSYFGTFSEDTGDGGKMVAAYTSQFGGGLSATVSAEDPRRREHLNTSAGGLGIVNATQLNTAATQNIAIRFPDIVGAVRYDQSWGSLQVMGAVHDASGGYYGSGSPLTTAGHPGDALGWAFGAGAILQTPFITQGDYLQVEANVSQGASGYNIAANASNAGGFFWYKGGQSIGLGLLADSVYGCTNAAGVASACTAVGGAVTNGTSMQLTSVWNVNASFEHFWTPTFRTSVHGNYANISYNDTAKSLICAGMANPVAGTFSRCDPNFQMWQVGSRAQYNFTPAFYMGVEVLYTRLNTGFAGTATTVTTAPQPGASVNIENQNIWSVTFRAHRDILP